MTLGVAAETATMSNAAPAEAAPAEATSTAEGEALPAETAPAEGKAPAEAAPAEGEAPAEPAPEEPKAPTPPPPDEPTSEPLEVTVEDKSDSSVTITWRPPKTIPANSGLDGYTVEITKEGTEDWKAVNEDLTVSCRYAIKNQTTGDRLLVRVVAVNSGGRSPPATIADPILVKEVGARPKVRLPRFLRQRYVKKVGEKINLVIPFSGKPKPVVTWLKDGEPLDPKRANIRTSDTDSILFVRQAERVDSGSYEMCVKVEDFEDKAAIIIQIIELPGPPASIKVADVWGFNVALEWTAPKDNGNTEITGYTVQKADKKTGDWFNILEHYTRLNATISDLIMGNTYTFRIFAENKCGLSEECARTKEEATIVKEVIDYKPTPFVERDFTEAPKFTTVLNDRSTTVGYSTKLLCSVRGSPKPKIMWMKNKMILNNMDNPKYRMISTGGICTLEIRKPGQYDGGEYVCRAENQLGKVDTGCKLEVKKPVYADADKDKEAE
ncbi:myosin-binding protein H [Oncorhynchus tshawytscha]|uniref:myosin-binding protein H n=1 Tax=Oncorhynchus tshawytscha TaxID=74940 RepID=UPI000D0A572E|nr:myosin-binding protein H [Oncorhynchus tshawytscha]